MAGFREFVTGEILTAANVDDFLAKQVVQKYADAAARDAALGTAVGGGNALREGMVAWLDDEDSVIAYDGTAWNPVGTEPPAGIGSNVVQAVKTDTFSTSSGSFVDVTGLEATITPTSNTSKILVMAYTVLDNTSSNTTGRGYAMQLVRGATPIFIGDASGSRLRAVSGGSNVVLNSNFSANNASPVFVDAPNTTDATTYKVQVRRTSDQSVVVNRSGQDNDNQDFVRTASSLVLIEVAP